MSARTDVTVHYTPRYSTVPRKSSANRAEPLTDFFTGTCFGAAVAVLFWTLFGR